MQASFQPNPTQSPVVTPAFAPLPLRARGVLEILDIAIKVYKQYFGVLLGWSAITIICKGVGTVLGFVVPFGSMLPSVMMTPLITGVVACCIAAAVRGQRVEFRQCWNFTKPRFWQMVGYYILALLIMSVILGVVFLVCGLLGAAGVWALGSAPRAVQIILGVLGGVVLLTFGTIATTVVLTWHYLVPIVVCLEEDKQNSKSLGRAFELLRRQWVQVSTLMTIVGLGLLVLWIILGITALLLIGLPDIQRAITGQNLGDARLWMMAITGLLTYIVLTMVWTPVFHLILVLFYFDVRIRQEALDLEWAAHVTAPPREAVIAVAPDLAPGAIHSFAANMAAPSPPAPPFAPLYPPPGQGTDFPAPTPPATVTPHANGMDPAVEPEVAASPFSNPGLSEPAPDLTHPAPVVTQPVLNAAIPPDGTPVSAPAPSYVSCPQCGTPAPASHVFCMRCGYQLKAAPTPSGNEAPQW